MDAVLRRSLEAGVVSAMATSGREPMQWGKDDCGLWFADIIKDRLGYDPAEGFRGRYKTRLGAMRAMGRKGILGAMRATARRHDWTRIDPNMAQPGDAGLVWTHVTVRGKSIPTLATVVCRSPGWFVGRNEGGFTAVRSEAVPIAWSVLDDCHAGARAILGNPAGLRKPFAQHVCHEPISLAVLSALAIEATATAVAVTNFVVYAALSVGVSLAASLLQPQSGTGAIDPNLSNINAVRGAQITERQPIPYKRVIVGSAYVGGAMFFEQVKPPYLYIGILVNHGEIAGIDNVFIGTNELQFTTLLPNTILTPIAVTGQPSYPTRLQCSFRYGADDQAIDPIIDADFASMDAQFRQRGIATAVFRYHYGADQAEFVELWGQTARPNSFMVARGVVVYDPRDPTQDLDDETTWQWSNNATLIQAWYLTRPFGGRIPTDKIRWDKIAESADYDDEVIATNDGDTIARHTIDGVIMLNQRPYEVMQKLLTANRGMVLEAAGQVWIQSSKPRDPVGTIHDRIIAGGIKYQSAKAKSDLVNKLQVRFVSPDQDYQIVDGPILSRTDLQADDQEVLPATLTLDFTQDHRRAQRLQKAFLDSSRLGRTIQCSVDLSLMAVAADELIGAVLTVDSELFSMANGDYMVTSVGFADDCTTLSLALTEYDSTIETSWTPSEDEQEFVLADLDVS